MLNRTIAIGSLKKNFIIITYIFLIASSSYSSDWEKLPEIPNSFRDINSITSIDSTLFVTVDGYVLKSIDNGLTWEKIYQSELSPSIALNSKNGIIYAHDCLNVAVSFDKGDTWTKYPSNCDFKRSFVVLDNFAYYIKGMQNIYRSDDNYNTWLDISNDIELPTIYNIITINNNIFISGQGPEGSIYYSNNHGDSWNNFKIDNIGISNYLEISSKSINNNFYFLGRKFISKSTDFGNTWTLKTFNEDVHFFGMFNYKNYEIAIDEDFKFYISNDNFRSWKIFENSLELNTLISELELYTTIVGSNIYYIKDRNIYKLDLSDLTSVNDKDNSLYSDIAIHPNPAMDFITINLGSIGAGTNENNIWASPNASIEIYDVMGMIIQTTKVETIHELSLRKIDVSNLSPGVYFVKIGDVIEKFVKY